MVYLVDFRETTSRSFSRKHGVGYSGICIGTEAKACFRNDGFVCLCVICMCLSCMQSSHAITRLGAYSLFERPPMHTAPPTLSLNPTDSAAAAVGAAVLVSGTQASYPSSQAHPLYPAPLAIPGLFAGSQTYFAGRGWCCLWGWRLTGLRTCIAVEAVESCGRKGWCLCAVELDVERAAVIGEGAR